MFTSSVRMCTYVEIKCQLDATYIFYCRSYCLLNMFQALLCPSSGAREYYTDGCCLWYLVLWFSSCRYGVELMVMCPVCRLQPETGHIRLKYSESITCANRTIDVVSKLKVKYYNFKARHPLCLALTHKQRRQSSIHPPIRKCI